MTARTPQQSGSARRRATRWATLLVLLTIGALAVAGTASANTAGPVDPATGFPGFYEDDNGVALDLCLDPARCVLPGAGEEPGYDPFQPALFPTNFPSESFYYIAESIFALPGGGQLRFRAAVEAAFANEDPIAGDQMTFSRLSIISTGGTLTPGESYTVTHPWGTDVLEADALGVISNRATRDFGCAVDINTPCDFSIAAGGRTFPFYAQANAPVGTVGDPLTEAALVTPVGVPNVVRIEGDGLPVGGVESGFFTVGGILGGASACSIAGDEGPNTLVGTEGDDVICGFGGNDTINGNGGNDTILGGEGNDTLRGGIGNDTIDGEGGNDTISPGNGNDDAIGGAGTDTLDFSAAAGGYTVNLVNGVSGRTGDSTDTDTVETVENVIGTPVADTLIGDDAANVINGGNGKNQIEGRGASDTLTGGGGIDTILGGDAADTINGAGGNDVLKGEAGSDTINAGGGDDAMTGGPGNDTLDGAVGVDTVDYSTSTLAVFVSLTTSSGGIAGDATDTDTLIQIDRVVGTDFPDTLVGGPNADTLVGGKGVDSINGNAGNDTIDAGEGNDSIVPGAGNDTVDGGLGKDMLNFISYAGGVTVDLLAGTAGRTGDPTDTDTILSLSVENVNGSNFPDTITGNDLANQLFGAGGADSLFGGIGGDTLNGGNGVDVLDGGNGNDVLQARDLTFADSLTGGNGTDSAQIDAGLDTTVTVETLLP